MDAQTQSITKISENDNSFDEYIYGEMEAILKDVFDLVDEAYYKDKSVDYLVECCRLAIDKIVTLHEFRYDPGKLLHYWLPDRLGC